jgi:hypothetical protein
MDSVRSSVTQSHTPEDHNVYIATAVKTSNITYVFSFNLISYCNSILINPFNITRNWILKIDGNHHRPNDMKSIEKQIGKIVNIVFVEITRKMNK